MLPRADETITVWPRKSATLRSFESGCTTMPSESALPTRVATIFSGVLPTAAASTGRSPAIAVSTAALRCASNSGAAPWKLAQR